MQHFKVRTHSYVFNTGGRYYNFICNEPLETGGAIYTGIDDDSHYFASHCSFEVMGLPKDKAKKIIAASKGG